MKLFLARLLLQLPADVSGATNTAAAVAAASGPVATILWAALTLAGLVIWRLYSSRDTLQLSASAAQSLAVSEASRIERERFAEDRAYLRTELKSAHERIDVINKDLRLQEAKSIEIMSATGSHLKDLVEVVERLQKTVESISTHD